MAKFLYNLGNFAFMKPKRMLIGWLLILVAVVAALRRKICQPNYFIFICSSPQ